MGLRGRGDISQRHASIEARRYFDQQFLSIPDPDFDTDVRSSLRYFGTVRGRIGWTVTTDRPAPPDRRTSLWPRRFVLSFPAVHSRVSTRHSGTSISKPIATWWAGLVAKPELPRLHRQAGISLCRSRQTNLRLQPRSRVLNQHYRSEQRMDFHTVRLGLNYSIGLVEAGGREILILKGESRRTRQIRSLQGPPGARSRRAGGLCSSKPTEVIE